MNPPSAIEVHAWYVDLDIDGSLDELARTLSADERARAASFVFERDRRRFVTARRALRSILASRVAVAPEKLEFRYASRGKPALAPWCRADDLRFNLSHSGSLAVVGLAQRHEVGVDVEQVRRLEDVRSLVAREFSPAERAAFERIPPDLRAEAFFQAWVRKEALIKATGEGLHRPLAEVEVTFGPDRPARVLAVGGDASISERWSLISLTPVSGYVGALVAEAPSLRLALHGCAEVSRQEA